MIAFQLLTDSCSAINLFQFDWHFCNAISRKREKKESETIKIIPLRNASNWHLCCTVSRGLHPFPGWRDSSIPIAWICCSYFHWFSPDDSLITYLFSPDHTLNRKVFAFDLETCKQELFFSPPDGGLDESNVSPEEKLRRERSRERGLGVTRYEWVKTSLKKRMIMVPLPVGVCS